LKKKLDIPHWHRMSKASELAINGLEFHQIDSFLEGLQSFTDLLKQGGFVAPHTHSILEKIQKESILAAKGCGAMGADVIFVVFEKHQKTKLLDKFQSFGYDIIASETDMFLGNAKK
jgi:mevalonate kinase